MDAPASLRIARWKNDASCAVSLYYDDGTDAAFDFAAPSLVRRRIPGTFYLCPGWFKGPDDPKWTRWGRLAAAHPEIVLGNHTWSHCGARDASALADELRRSDAALRALAGLPPDALVSFGVPGGVPWNVTPEEEARRLAAVRCVRRHGFAPENAGGPAGLHPDVRMHRFEDAVAVLDRAEASGGWEALLFHGVGGDWIAFPASDHERLLREIDLRRAAGRVWPGSAIAVHKYEAERAAARLEPLPAEDGALAAARLSVPLPGPGFDEPLTFVASVPPGRDGVSVSAGAVSLRAPVADGRAVFDLPPVPAAVVVR